MSMVFTSPTTSSTSASKDFSYPGAFGTTVACSVVRSEADSPRLFGLTIVGRPPKCLTSARESRGATDGSRPNSTESVRSNVTCLGRQ